MSQIISFSADQSFLSSLDSLMDSAGYQNRSRFLRDAALHFSEVKQRGELMNMNDEIIIEGHIIVHYEHKTGQKLMVSRSGEVEVAGYHHTSRLGHSCHSCVDVIHMKGQASEIRKIHDRLQNTPNVEKVSFIIAPMKNYDCC